MTEEWKAYELQRRRYPSTAFYVLPPVKHGLTVAMAIIFIILTIVVVVVIYLLIRNRRRACTRAPSRPNDVSAGYLSSTQFIVQWRGSNTAESYKVYVGTVSRFAINNAVSVTTTKGTRATITGLTINRTYYIVVTANNNCGESSISPEITFVYLE